MAKEYWITNSRFKYIGIILFLMFLIFMFLIYLKADELTHNPCQLCAKKMVKGSVTCSTTQFQRTFHLDYSITDKEFLKDIEDYKLNLSSLG